jgi:hypothetical protein
MPRYLDRFTTNPKLPEETQIAFAIAQMAWPRYWRVALAEALGLHPSSVTRWSRGCGHPRQEDIFRR